MTSLDAVKSVYAYLKTQSLNVDLFQYTKPATVVKTEFIVINSLEANEGELQIAIVNCNIFVNDIEPGTPNDGRLKTLVDLVKSKFPKYSSTSRSNMFSIGTVLINDQEGGRHYVNLRLRVEMLN